MRKLTSEKKIEANRRNAKKSTGPRTRRGKERSSINALTTGVYSNVWLLPDENIEAYLRLSSDILDELKPEGCIEKEIVQQIIFDTWRLSRLQRAERALINRALDTRWNDALERLSSSQRDTLSSLVDIPEVQATLMVLHNSDLNESPSVTSLLGKGMEHCSRERKKSNNAVLDSEENVSDDGERAAALQMFIERHDLGAALLEAFVPADGSQDMERLDRQRRAIRKDLLNSYSALKTIQDRRLQEAAVSQHQQVDQNRKIK